MELGFAEIGVEWACENGSAGNTFTLRAGNSVLSAKVQGTDTWDDYRRQRIGSIEIPAGRQQIIMGPSGNIRGAMIDLKGIELKLGVASPAHAK